MKQFIEDQLFPYAIRIVNSAIAKIPESDEIEQQLVELCLKFLSKAVKNTKTDVDDQIFEQVAKALRARTDKGDLPGADDFS